MIKFNRINGWSYKTSDNAYIISNCGNRTWFSAEIDAEAQNWVRNYNYVAVSA